MDGKKADLRHYCNSDDQWRRGALKKSLENVIGYYTHSAEGGGVSQICWLTPSRLFLHIGRKLVTPNKSVRIRPEKSNSLIRWKRLKGITSEFDLQLDFWHKGTHKW